MNETLRVELENWVDDVDCMTKSLQLVASYFSEGRDLPALAPVA